MLGNVQTLDLSYNSLGDVGIQLLSVGLKGQIKIKKLFLVDCKFTTVGAQEFFINLGINASLTNLKIDENKIGKGRLEGSKIDRKK